MAPLSNNSMSAVDAIIAETADLIALEQIAALNTAHLSTDSPLSSNLESRFRKLKSLPNRSIPPRRTSLDRSGSAPVRNSAAHAFAHEEEEQRHTHHESNKNNSATVPIEEAREGIEIPKQQSLGGSSASGGPAARVRDRDTDWDWDINPSPPKQGCCFVFSPKKVPQTQMRSKRGGGGGGHDDLFGMGGDDLRELGADSKRIVAELKEQQYKLKKALREQEKASRETAKMARWVKQASARMTHSAAIDDLLSDHDEEAQEFK